MAQRLILDTGVLVSSERGRSGIADVIAEDDDLAVAAITVAERADLIRHGRLAGGRA